MDKKETKKGFWATLFAPKKKSCCFDSDIIAEDDVKAPAPGRKVSEVLVLGPGCAKCKKTYEIVERVIADNRLDVRLSKIEDIAEMMNYNIMTTPAVVVDGKVRIKGHVPTVDEVKQILGL